MLLSRCFRGSRIAYRECNIRDELGGGHGADLTSVKIMSSTKKWRCAVLGILRLKRFAFSPLPRNLHRRPNAQHEPNVERASCECDILDIPFRIASRRSIRGKIRRNVLLLRSLFLRRELRFAREVIKVFLFFFFFISFLFWIKLITAMSHVTCMTNRVSMYED